MGPGGSDRRRHRARCLVEREHRPHRGLDCEHCDRSGRCRGNVTLFSSIGTDLVADVVGYFTGASAASATTGLFVPVTPQRLADSRVTGAVVAGNRTITVPVAGRPNLPDTAPTAIAGTLTATEIVRRRIRPGVPDGIDDRSRIDLDAELERPRPHAGGRHGRRDGPEARSVSSRPTRLI